MTEYPIAVRRYDEEHPSDLAVCEDCERQAKFDPAEGDPYDLCLTCETCGGRVLWKFEETDSCKNCDKLGWGTADVEGCCSRRCLLQWEYAIRLQVSS